MKINGVIWVFIIALSLLIAIVWWYIFRDVGTATAAFLGSFMVIFVGLVVMAMMGWIDSGSH